MTDTPTFEQLDEMGKAIWARISTPIFDWSALDEGTRRALRLAAQDVVNIYTRQVVCDLVSKRVNLQPHASGSLPPAPGRNKSTASTDR